MKLVTYRTQKSELSTAASRGGILLNDRIYDLSKVGIWLEQNRNVVLDKIPGTLPDFIHLSAEHRQLFAEQQDKLFRSMLIALPLENVTLLAPIEHPTSLRDFYAFEQHVKTARANRGLEMIPEWYNSPVFYFSNHNAIYPPEAEIAYPLGSQALDFELEIACVIGKAGRNISAENAHQHIVGYLIMNDWSARDLQMAEMKVGLGPAKGKDFATSLGPWLVTPDELADVRVGECATERYNLVMQARLNGQRIAFGNFKDIYFSFPQLIERASLNVNLLPGDVIGSGTVGTGCLLEQGAYRERWLQPGDVLELEIDRLGVLRNKVIEPEQLDAPALNQLEIEQKANDDPSA